MTSEPKLVGLVVHKIVMRRCRFMQTSLHAPQNQLVASLEPRPRRGLPQPPNLSVTREWGGDPLNHHPTKGKLIQTWPSNMTLKGLKAKICLAPCRHHQCRTPGSSPNKSKPPPPRPARLPSSSLLPPSSPPPPALPRPAPQQLRAARGQDTSAARGGQQPTAPEALLARAKSEVNQGETWHPGSGCQGNQGETELAPIPFLGAQVLAFGCFAGHQVRFNPKPVSQSPIFSSE